MRLGLPSILASGLMLAGCSASATYPTQGPDDVCFYDPAPVCRPVEGAPFTARQVADCQQAEGQLFAYSGLSDLPPEVLRTQRVDLVSNVLRDVQTLKRLRTPSVALAAWQAFVTLLRATGPKLGNRISDAAFGKALLALAQADRGWRPRCDDVDLWGTQHGVGAGGRPSGSG